jgi:hypothetical protein
MKCENCHDSHVTEIPHAPTWIRQNGREFKCANCGHITGQKKYMVTL